MLAASLSCDVPSIAFNVGNTVVLILLSAYVLYKIRSANLRKKRIAEHFEQKRQRALQTGAISDGPLPLDATVVSVASASASLSAGSGSRGPSSHAHSTNASVLSAASEAGPASSAPVKDKLVFPIYFTFLKVACLLYIIRAILSTVGIVGNYSARSFAFVQVAFVHPLTVGVSEGLSFFLVLRSVGQDAIRKTSIFTALWIIAQMIEGIVFWVFDNDSDLLRLSLMRAGRRCVCHPGAADLNIPENVGAYWFSLDGVRVAFYGAILLYMACTRTKRLANYPYAAFHLVCYSLSVLADTLYQTHHPGSDCILFTTWSIWTIVWPPLAYYTLRMDSRYWSKIGKEAGAEASPAVRKRKKTDSKGKSRSRNNSLGSVGSAASRSPLLPILDDNMRGRKPPRGFIVDFSNLTFLEEIGAGGTSRVYRGLLRGQEVAIKQFRCEMLTPEYIQRFAMEMAIASRLVHKNIVQCLGVCVVPPSICMVSEFMERGSLFHVLGRYKGLSALRRLDFALDAASAVHFLHEQRPRILHRDIKSLNFLIDRHWNLKLADLGEAREIGGDAIGSDRALTQERGTPQWMAPETFTSVHYTEKVDIYSLGIVFWEIATGMRPFSHLSPWLVPAAVLERHERPPLTGTVVPSIPLEFVHLIQRCWRTDPNVRPSAEQVVRELTVIRDQTAQLLLQSVQPTSPAPPSGGPVGDPSPGPTGGPSEARPAEDDRKQRMSV